MDAGNVSVFVDQREGVGAPIASSVPATELAAVSSALAIGLDSDVDIGNNLPGDHPAWAKDVVSLSARFRAMALQIKPLVIRVLNFWDHQLRSIVVGGRRLGVDASGCYRME
jgi:hypothetical protein